VLHPLEDAGLRGEVRVLPLDEGLHVLLTSTEGLELLEDPGDVLAEVGWRALIGPPFRGLVEEPGVHGQHTGERFRLMLVQDTLPAFDLAEEGRAEAREVDEVGEVLAPLHVRHAPGCSHAGTDAFSFLAVHEPHARAIF
jgi:hypothetical protein